jgi:YD repeat-containing protein
MTHIEYDLAWQKTAEIVGYGTVDEAVTEFVYDAAGNLTTSTDPRGKIWSRTYDARNRMLTMSDPLNNTTSWTYDAVGNKLTETRPNNGVTTMTYDAMNRKVTSTDPKNQATAFTYGGTSLASGTKGNNLVRLTDARNNSYDFTYDLADRKISMIYPGGSHEDWAYDAVGNVTTCTTRAGQVKTCTYDNRNRNTSCDWSDSTPDVSQTFDAVGRILSMSNNVSMLTYAYDAANQLLSETQDIDIPVNLPAKTVSYGYDVDGNRSSVTYPDGMVVNYTYTKRDQLEQIVVDGPPPLASYTYDLGGNRIGKTLENGTSVSYTYDDSSRLTSIDHKNGGVSFQRFDYALNNVGNRTSRTETVAGSTKLDAYSHDEIDQLTQVQYDRNSATNTQARQVNYAYDATGNRTETAEDSDGSGPAGATTTPYTANNLNQYTSIDGLIPPAYDANGNLATIQLSSSDPTWNYVYDSENRLVSGNNATGTVFNFAMILGIAGWRKPLTE